MPGLNDWIFLVKFPEEKTKHGSCFINPHYYDNTEWEIVVVTLICPTLITSGTVIQSKSTGNMITFGNAGYLVGNMVTFGNTGSY